MTVFDFDVEYAVQMKCESCKEKIIQELSTIKGLTIVNIDLNEQSLIVRLGEFSPNAFQVQHLIENKLGINAIVRGTGDFVTAVSEIHGAEKYSRVVGVARFVQNENQQCLLDAVIDGLETEKLYHLGMHEYGDLSEANYRSIGDEVFSFAKKIGSNSGRLNVKSRVDNCDLTSFIGRAFALKTTESEIVAAGIVARASKIRDNFKKICACSGKSLWEERENSKI